jgi:ATP-citrate lyase beta-subunit
MARVKISEFRAKKLLIGSSYAGVSVSNYSPQEDIAQLNDDTKYIIKVDQGIKKRGKQGLIRLNVGKSNAKIAIEELAPKGFDRFIAEPMHPHDDKDEHYVSFERTREGILVSYSPHGGIEVEEHPESVQQFLYIPEVNELTHDTPLTLKFISHVVSVMNKQHFGFVEINPLVIENGTFVLLDAAVLADDAGEYFVDGWSEDDVVDAGESTPQEKAVKVMDDNSPAALKLKVLHQNGSIWTLFSGGGASITIADEIQAAGLGKQLGNYGEYSGNPTGEETYLYTKEVLSLLLQSSASKKVLIIAGGVANFTDVKKTFAGLIKALDEVASSLQSQGVKVFVRRGGPNEEEGLAHMKKFLADNHLLGSIYGSNDVLTQAIDEGIDWLLRDEND